MKETPKHRMANAYVGGVVLTALSAGLLGGMSLMFPPTKILLLLAVLFSASMFLLMYRFIKLTYFLKHNFGSEPATDIEESFTKAFKEAFWLATKKIFNPRNWRK